jgi:uncharacterized membrane protein
MVEIFILYLLGKRISRRAKEKGRTGWKAILLLIGFWFGFEIFAAIVLAVITVVSRANDVPVLVEYIGILGLAILGAALAFKIVESLPAKVAHQVIQKPQTPIAS